MRRDIMKNKRLTDPVLHSTKAKALHAYTPPVMEMTVKKSIVIDETKAHNCNWKNRNIAGEKCPCHERSYNYIKTVGRSKRAKKPRLQLPRIEKHAWMHGAIDIANKAIIVIKVKIGRPLKLTYSNQIVYSTASIITQQTNQIIKKTKLKQRENLSGKKKWRKKSWKSKWFTSSYRNTERPRGREKREKQLEKLYNVKNATDIPVVRE